MHFLLNNLEMKLINSFIIVIYCTIVMLLKSGMTRKQVLTSLCEQVVRVIERMKKCSVILHRATVFPLTSTSDVPSCFVFNSRKRREAFFLKDSIYVYTGGYYMFVRVAPSSGKRSVS